MAALIRLVAALLALALTPGSASAQETKPPPRSSPSIERWRSIIAEASQRFGVPQAWIAAVMNVESRGNTHLAGRPIVSRAGAMGLMQLMPGTWLAMRQIHGLGTDPHAPYDNIMAGSAYLRAMYDRFGYPGLFGAYNAGPARYAEHLRTGKPLPPETRGYIDQLSGAPAVQSIPPVMVSGTSLFFALGTGMNAPAPGDENARATAIIVPQGQASEPPK
ncbi:lytic transglycosylase catalytic subunit [Novosphingobium sp. Rr 2-17]|uniref:lytic transglycosylase domain-containing protein n=1 Tax=Novosphingobium sp. Rr 2-17 TaxID=555793 RepID=UPI0002699C03|nr:lytic transglycosylase domain-containing protein [Novosphingobium sp. Rr 2-17]EIZ77986.1 lytic transglycosylase catalytic subunit [Novosphingobium sp. Rr 2-17]